MTDLQAENLDYSQWRWRTSLPLALVRSKVRWEQAGQVLVSEGVPAQAQAMG